jgi:reductive dehalogenase
VAVGVTPLQDYHFYAFKGRGARYGQPLEAQEGFGIAFAVEMDHRQMGSAPEGPTVMESAQQYLESGAVAVQLAEFIRRLGFKAEAHIDGNYKVICPLVARDAGVGEIGRMGLTMTPGLGPRVRLGVVTTELPLVADRPAVDPALLDFCRICRKCADVCPVNAIPDGDPEVVDGVARWRLDSEACFGYWCATGTDCGQCMKVCPYSHPATGLHDLVRWGLQRSGNFRRFALRMDDWLYGRCPKPHGVPDWVPPRGKKV